MRVHSTVWMVSVTTTVYDDGVGDGDGGGGGGTERRRSRCGLQDVLLDKDRPRAAGRIYYSINTYTFPFRCSYTLDVVFLPGA